MLIVLVALLSMLPYVLVMDGPFIYDDRPLIERNETVHHMDDLSAIVAAGVWDVAGEEGREEVGQYFRPLVLLSFAWDWWLGGGRSWSFHLTNLILSAIASGLAMAVLFRWLDGDVKLALLAGVLFALHPTKAESVAWISGRPDLILMIGIGLVLVGHARSLGWDHGGSFGQRRPVIGGTLQVVGAMMAFCAKEHAVVLPAFVLSQLVFLRGGRLGALKAMDYRQVLVYALASALYLVARSKLVPFSTISVSLDWVTRLLLIVDSCGRYLELLLFPHDLSLFSAYQPLSLGLSGRLRSMYQFLGAAHLVLLSVWGWLALRRLGSDFVLWLLYLACLLPVINLRPLGTDLTVAPRYLFLPSFPLGVAVALGVSRWCRGRMFDVATAVATLLGLALCFDRGRDFSSSEAFWRYELGHNARVAPVATANVAIDQEMGQARRAVARASCALGLAKSQINGKALGRALDLLTVGLVQATPVSERDVLTDVADFIERILDGRTASLVWYDVPLHVAPSRIERAAVDRVRPNLLATQAVLAAKRLDPRATFFALRAVQQCARCPDVVVPAARAAVASLSLNAANSWLSAAGMGEVDLLGSGPASELFDELRAVRQRADGGDALAQLSLLVRTGNVSALQFARSHPQLRDAAPAMLRLQMAQAACRHGADDLAKSWLSGLLSEEELRPVFDEFKKQSKIVRPNEAPFRFVPGTCATAEELD